MEELAFFCSLWYNQTQRGGVNVIRSTKLISTVSAGILIFLTMSACSENKSHEDNAPSQFEISAPDSSSLPEKQENQWWENSCFPGVCIRLPKNDAFCVPENGNSSILLCSASAPEQVVLKAQESYRNLWGLSEAEMANRIISWYLSYPDSITNTDDLPNKSGIILKRLSVKGTEESEPMFYYLAQTNDITFVLNCPQPSQTEREAAEHMLEDMEIDCSNLSFNYDPYNDTSDDTPYCYGVLNEEDRKLYNEIHTEITPDTVGTGKVWKRKCSPEDAQRYERIAYGIMHDYEEEDNYYDFDIDYKNGEFRLKAVSVLFDHSEDLALRETINKKADEILADIPEGLTRYGKYAYLAEVVCNMTEYDYAASGEPGTEQLTPKTSYPWGVRGPFEDGAAVCEGYSNAYTVLCERAGLFCDTVSGGDHAWNLIRLNGEYYFFDTTWMDSPDQRYGNTYIMPFGKEDPQHAEKIKAPRCQIEHYDEYLDVLQQTGSIDWIKENLLTPDE